MKTAVILTKPSVILLEVGVMGGRKVADCRLMPSEKNCSLCISGTEDEVLSVAVRHAVNEHGHEYSEQLRNEIKSMMKDE